MHVELYEKLSNLRFGVWMVAIGIVAVLVILRNQSQRVEILDLKVQAMAKQLAVANERKGG